MLDCWQTLSDDLLFLIFRKLNIFDVCRVSSVCRRWRLVAKQIICSVRELELGKSLKPFYHIPKGKQIICLLRKFTELQTLSLRNWPWFDRLPEIASIVLKSVRSTSLRKLDVGPLPLSLGDLFLLRENCPNICCLQLQGCPSVSDKLVIGVLRHWRPHLVELDISDCPSVTSSSVRVAVESGVHRLKASRCKKITGALVLSTKPFMGRKLEMGEPFLILTQCKNINWFFVNGQVGFVHINLSQCTSLEYCHVYDHSLTSIQLSGCRSLRDLKIISKNLKTANLFSCTQLSEEMVYKLLYNCPKLTCINLSGLPFDSSVQAWLREHRLNHVKYDAIHIH
eukprot:jgi/Galph1/3208/GphlegSOOS_G1847.1